jgi:hypothetical protein
MRAILKRGWYARQIDEGVDLKASGIYEWGVYVGKAATLRSRINAYPRNVRHIIQNRHYHGNPHGKFRPVHNALHTAYLGGTAVTVRVVEVCHRSVLNEREKYWISIRRQEAQAGGLPVLNSG